MAVAETAELAVQVLIIDCCGGNLSPQGWSTLKVHWIRARLPDNQKTPELPVCWEASEVFVPASVLVSREVLCAVAPGWYQGQIVGPSQDSIMTHNLVMIPVCCNSRWP